MVQTVSQLEFGILHGKQVVGGFDGGDISSDGGIRAGPAVTGVAPS